MTINYFYKNTKSKFLEISGLDSITFIQNLITNDINKSGKNEFIYSCLLTPQGKFLSDFFIYKKNEKFILEINEKFYENFLNKINLYKLQSKVKIAELYSKYSFVIFSETKVKSKYEIFNYDPRNKLIGKKLITNEPLVKFNLILNEINEKTYHEILIKNKIPYSPYDLEENKSLLLENNFDNINAISWDKGCFIGQEITARMKYRSLLKKKLYSLKILNGSISVGEKVIQNNQDLGYVVSKEKDYLFCMLKIDKVNDKIKNDEILQTDSSASLKFL